MAVRAPSWSTTLGLRHVYTEKRRSSKRARVQEELNVIHYPRDAACLFTRLLAEESSDFIESHCGVPSREKNLTKLLYICTCVFLIYEVLEYVYHSACDKKFSVQLDPYLVQSKYIFRIYVSKLITTQSSSPYSHGWPLRNASIKKHMLTFLMYV